MKKLLFSMMAGLLIIGLITGCGNTGAVKTDSPKPVADAPKNTTSQITEEEALAFVKEFIDDFYKGTYKDKASISDYNKFITASMREEMKNYQEKDWKEFSTDKKEEDGVLIEAKVYGMDKTGITFKTKVFVTMYNKDGQKIKDGISNGIVTVRKQSDGTLVITTFHFAPDPASIKTYSVNK